MQETANHLHEGLNDELQPGDGIERAKEDDGYRAEQEGDDQAPPRQCRVALVDEDQRNHHRDQQRDEVPVSSQGY